MAMLFEVNARPSYFSCNTFTCLSGKAPGGSFSAMGQSQFKNDVSTSKGDPCFVQLETIAGALVTEYEVGVKYNVAVYSAAPNGFKIAASAGNVANINVDAKSTGTKQAWTGVADASTDFIALCGSFQGIFVSNKHSVAKKQAPSVTTKPTTTAASQTQAPSVTTKPTTTAASDSCFSDGGVAFDAKLTDDKTSVVVTMSTTKGTWVGVGFKTTKGSMTGADIYIGSEGKTVTDRKAVGNFMPAKDAQQNVDSSRCTKTGGKLTCEFQRKLVTGDADDQPLDKEVYLLYAYGNGDADSPSYHTFRGTTGKTLDVAKCVKIEAEKCQYSSSKLFRVHGFLMMLAWMLMLPFGIFLGATKDAFNQRHEVKTCFQKTLQFWFVIHRPLQAAGVLVMLIAIIIIFVANNATGLQHMKYAHHFLGIVTFILAALQPIMAPIRKLWKDKDPVKSEKIHLIWHIIHAIFGYGSQILAFATVYLGIQYVQNGPSSTQYSVRPLSIAGFSIVVAGFVFFLVLGLIWSKMNKMRLKSKTVVALEDPASKAEKVTKEKPVKGVNPWPMTVLLTLLVVGSVLLWVDNFYPCQ